MEGEREQKILETISKIKNSQVSVREYFEINDVPFSRARFYKYCKLIREHGKEGLYDKRQNGNYTKLKGWLKNYIISEVKESPSISSAKLVIKIKKRFKITISRHSINNFRKSVGLTRQAPTKEEKYEIQESGGGEILTSLAFYTRIIEVITKTIMQKAYEVSRQRLFEKNIKKDYPRYRNKGKFTKRYNKLKQVRENRFKSIDEKIPQKNFASMKIFQMSKKTISRYNLALLCLPLVTTNGRSSRVNRVKGNDLDFLCGYNYKDASLDKYLCELKYLKVSENLIIETAKFWMNYWQEKGEQQIYFVCYYIDGNTKALWSSARHYKGKVTMIGRVMNCLENVFIHDGKGHPLYFQTFCGNADLGQNALKMLSKLTKHLNDSSVDVKRILVMDGGGNSVKTMRAFEGSEENFITILDNNQTQDRKFKHMGKRERYKYGAANLIDCKIELIDSSEKDYICELRAVIVEWDNNRKSVLVTDIDEDLLDASEITKKYFDRWPKQEKRFRDEKAGVNIHRIVGYGKKLENYDKMNEKHRVLCNKIKTLRMKLKNPLKEIEDLEKKLRSLYKKEKTIREKSTIELGKRILNDEDKKELKQCESGIAKYIREQNKIRNGYRSDFDKLKNYTKEEERIRFKDKVYRIDTELDQIVTCFKLSFVNLCSIFLKECMNDEKYELTTLFESIFQLKGKSRITDKEKIINLKENLKEPDLMKKLKKGLDILKAMRIMDLENHLMHFSI